jgi:hypothetical protein
MWGQPPSAVRRAKLDFFRAFPELAPSYKNHKAGLVGPAFPLWNWFVGHCWIGKPECLNLGCRRVLLLSRLRNLAQQTQDSGSKVSTRKLKSRTSLHHHRQILQLVLEDWDCTTGHFDASRCVERCRG